MQEKIKIAVADDHWIVAAGIQQVLSRERFDITVSTANGKELLQTFYRLGTEDLPDIALIDINMPVMDGYATVSAITQTYPTVKPVALSMYDNEHSILQMLRCGARGYVRKDSDPISLEVALEAVAAGGYYHPEIDPSLVHHKTSTNQTALLTAKEITFLEYCCSDMTYNEIADTLCRSINTIYDYRESLYEKLGLKTRAGLIVYALQSGLVLPRQRKP